MRIVFQGSLTPKQLGESVQEIVMNTLEKAEVEGKKYLLHNVVVEMNLNIKGHDEPMLIMDDERDIMFTVHTGIEKGKLVDYVPVDRTELIEKFNDVTDNYLQKADEEKVEEFNKEMKEIQGEVIEAEFKEVE